MTCIEHYFENLLFNGQDTNGNPNKNALSPEVQEAIEICAQYVLYTTFYGRQDFAEYIKNKHDRRTGMTDLIERKAVLNIIDAEVWEYIDYLNKDIGGNYNCHISLLSENIRDRIINDLPSATTKTGHFERHYSRPNVYADLWWHCSVCGYKAERKFNYCPGCGSRMIDKGEQE